MKGTVEKLVSVLDSGSNGPGLNPGWGHCVVFLDKTVFAQCPSPPRCINNIGMGELLV